MCKIFLNQKFNPILLSFILGALSYYMFLSYSQMAGGKYVILYNILKLDL